MQRAPLFRVCLLLAALLCACEWLPAQALTIGTEELPWAIKGAPYHGELITAVNGRCPLGDVHVTITEGQLPKGLSLFSSEIEGTPQQMGHFRFTLRAANTCVSATKKLDLLVTGKPILMVVPLHLALQYRPGAGSDGWLEDILRVEGSWPNLPYSIDISHAPWLSAEPSEGKTPDPQSAFTGDRVRVKADPSKLAPGTYHADLKFYAHGSENVPKVEVTLQVLKAD